MKYFHTFLTLLLFSCGSESLSPERKSENPVTIQFFETYSINDIRNQWLDACKWSAETDPLKQNEETIGLKGLKRFIFSNYNNTIGFAKKENISAVDSILALPEVAKLFPKDLKFMWSQRSQTSTIDSSKGFCLYALKIPANGKALLDSHDIEESIPVINKNTGMVDVHVNMTKTGSQKLKKLTEDNFDRFIAIALNGEVISYSRVMEVVVKNLRIDENFTMEEAGYLSDRMNAGR